MNCIKVNSLRKGNLPPTALSNHPPPLTPPTRPPTAYQIAPLNKKRLNLESFGANLNMSMAGGDVKGQRSERTPPPPPPEAPSTPLSAAPPNPPEAGSGKGRKWRNQQSADSDLGILICISFASHLHISCIRMTSGIYPHFF